MISSLEQRRNLLKGLAFISPWIVGFIAFTAIPLVLSGYYSFCDYSLLQPPTWRGTENYQTIFSDVPVFWKALWVTFYYAIFAMPLGTLVALSLALLLNSKVKGQAIYRTIIYLPSLVPSVASCMLWLWLFNSKLGLINTFLKADRNSKTAGLGCRMFPWAMPALVLMSIWGVGTRYGGHLSCRLAGCAPRVVRSRRSGRSKYLGQDSQCHAALHLTGDFL